MGYNVILLTRSAIKMSIHIGLRHIGSCDHSLLQAGVTVKYTFMGKPARQSGLKSGDIILLYTSATRDRMDPSMPAYDKNVFLRTMCVVLLVVRKR